MEKPIVSQGQDKLGSKPEGAALSGVVDINSPEFAMKLTSLFAAATRDAVAEHHKAGRAVPGIKNGELVEIGPDGAAVSLSPKRRR